MTSTASAVLLDTRNGYLYGIAKATSQQSHFTSGWQNAQAIDRTRREAESNAFEKLVGELESTWRGVVMNYGNPKQAAVE